MDISENASVNNRHSVVLKGIYVYGSGNNYYQLIFYVHFQPEHILTGDFRIINKRRMAYG